MLWRSISPSLLGLPVADFGTQEQQAELLPALVGKEFEPGSLALVEPRFDFDVFQPQTRARRDGSEYVIEGSSRLQLGLHLHHFEATQQINQLIVARRILNYSSSMLR